MALDWTLAVVFLLILAAIPRLPPNQGPTCATPHAARMGPDQAGALDEVWFLSIITLCRLLDSCLGGEDWRGSAEAMDGYWLPGFFAAGAPHLFSQTAQAGTFPATWLCLSTVKATTAARASRKRYPAPTILQSLSRVGREADTEPTQAERHDQCRFSGLAGGGGLEGPLKVTIHRPKGVACRPLSTGTLGVVGSHKANWEGLVDENAKKCQDGGSKTTLGCRGSRQLGCALKNPDGDVVPIALLSDKASFLGSSIPNQDPLPANDHMENDQRPGLANNDGQKLSACIAMRKLVPVVRAVVPAQDTKYFSPLDGIPRPMRASHHMRMAAAGRILDS
ncbi:hypothetical protein B0T17DRAFT_627772 [Bombardia bombarda]|uniref:Uncharacterized protein n=1 Tax=Bombardia bombarda TaxID=252184 RepID=A0AA39XPT6_9PEZI|nr:hypothetical protein B0T17DRAFT_627772 [Bombardia bombarda]